MAVWDDVGWWAVVAAVLLRNRANSEGFDSIIVHGSVKINKKVAPLSLQGSLVHVGLQPCRQLMVGCPD